jgi:hypothetical protein
MVKLITILFKSFFILNFKVIFMALVYIRDKNHTLLKSLVEKFKKQNPQLKVTQDYIIGLGLNVLRGGKIDRGRTRTK